ncbi:MAG: RNA polymerase sigma factor [Ilumatobacteraceae bacterium]
MNELLVRRAINGDRAALDTVLREEYPRILTACRRLLGRHADADDAAQNALISIARNIGSFDQRSSFSTWVWRIATNAALDEIRRRGRRDVPSSDRHDFDRPDRSAVSAIDDRQIVEAALLRLPLEFRTAVVLRDLADLDYDEIADVLDIPIGTVRSRISRGRSQLADLIRESSATSPGNQGAGTERQTPGSAP